jgi:hypothetical protein
MNNEIIIEFLKGYVDTLGRTWLKGMIHSFAEDYANELISKGIAKKVEPKVPASRRIIAKDEK